MGNMRFKVGDRVQIKSLDWYNRNKDKDGIVELSTHVFIPEMLEHCGTIVTIKDVFEDTNGNAVYYMKEIDWDWTDEMIEGLVEEESLTPPLKHPEDSALAMLFHKTLILPEGYQFVDENGNVINAKKIVLEKKRKEYPKTYEECCDTLSVCSSEHTSLVAAQLDLPMNTFIRLLVARNAYWKIAGEEMGLGKPWEPSGNEDCFVISRSCGEVYLYSSAGDCEPFEFPTPEMRDAFYENFKKEIETVKELL